MGRVIKLGDQLEGTPDLDTLLKTQGARLRDIGGQEVWVEYDMNKDSINAAAFNIIIKRAGPHGDDVRITCYKEQLLRILRAV